MNLGDDHYDVDVPTKMETDLVQNGRLMKFLWLFGMPVILIARSLTKLPVKWNMYVVLNWATCIIPTLSLLAINPKCFVFVFVSAYLSQSIHPANVRAVQRHVSSMEAHKATQGDARLLAMPNTYSYYGAMNWLTLNVGYHVEHHDFARVPWPNLPALHALGGEKWYPESHAHKSRSLSALVEFVYNPHIFLDWFSAHQEARLKEE